MSGRRPVLATVALTGAVAALSAGGASADPGGASLRAKDQVVGSAVNAFPLPLAGPGEARLTVSTRSEPLGIDPEGQVHAMGSGGAPMTEFRVQGEVTCLQVQGNRASIKYRFDKASGSAATLQGGGVEVFIEDDGQPRGGRPVDQNGFGPPQDRTTFEASMPQRCDPPETGNYSPVRQGDYKVRQSRDGD